MNLDEDAPRLARTIARHLKTCRDFRRAEWQLETDLALRFEDVSAGVDFGEEVGLFASRSRNWTRFIELRAA